MKNNRNILIIVISLLIVTVTVVFLVLIDRSDKSRVSDSPAVSESFMSPGEAANKVGAEVSVQGVVKYIFNNGKVVLLGFNDPHEGYFKALISKESWVNFGPDLNPSVGRNIAGMFKEGETVLVSGPVKKYQGDPVIYVETPANIKTISETPADNQKSDVFSKIKLFMAGLFTREK